MTQEEKDLLVKDLCARLPHGVFCKIQGYEEPKQLIRIEKDEVSEVLLYFGCNKKGAWPIRAYPSEVKPYLRPISSMTKKKERKELGNITIGLELEYLKDTENCSTKSTESVTFEIDFYNSKHIDYRGLIPKGLALEALKDMYNGNKN